MQHHAYCIVGSFESALATIPEADRVVGIDVSLDTYTQFTIAEARALTHASNQRPVDNTHRVFIISFSTATLEAQNALLKLFEEPAPTSRFYIIVPFIDVLIKTVLSRLMVRSVTSSEEVEVAVAEEFLRQTCGERLLTIASRTKEKDDTWCNALLQGIERYAEKHPESGATEVLFVEKFVRASGASKKMLLEHLALSL